MKFLCVPCDEPMRLEQTRPPEEGSITLVYACDECGYEMAMLTNPLETQLVSSLGVKVGTSPAGEAAAEASKCPFSSMIAGAESEPPGDAAAGNGVRWTAEARQRMQTVPDFVRPMAMSGIEQFARDRGYGEITETVLDEAREHFGM